MFFSVPYPNEESVQIKPHETLIDDELRIKHLKEHFLINLGLRADAGWSELWQDPIDTRYWETTYVNSNYQGGGIQIFHNISESIVKLKYHAKKN